MSGNPKGKGKLDPHADWLLLRVNQSLSKTRRDMLELLGVEITMSSLSRWYSKRRGASIVRVEQRADAITTLTGEIIQADWIKYRTEIQEGFNRALADGDDEGARRWMALALRQLDTYVKAKMGLPAPEKAEQEVELIAWAKKVLS